MKKIVFLLIFVGMMSMPVFADEGSLKAGAMAGDPSALTLGYRFSDTFEVNGLLGIGFGYYSYAAVIIGANALFTVYTIDIEGQQFPLSIGPQVITAFGLDDYYDVFGFEGLLNVRLEYTFDEMPLNLFVEAGLGLGYTSWTWTFFSSDYSGSEFGLAWSGSIGARYVF
jgi:hypothetical protein